MSDKNVFIFIGVSTAQSSSVHSFPLWMDVLGRPDVEMEGVDFDLNDKPERYRATLQRIREKPEVLGALVTSHKISIVEAGRDLFDELTPFAEILGEASCIYKRDGKMIGEAMDAFAGGAALDDEIGEDYFAISSGHLLILGAGGAATGLLLHLLSKENTSARPRNIALVDRSPERLSRLEAILDKIDHTASIDFLLHDTSEQNDAVMRRLPTGSVVINATGMGKDTPGSPVTDAVRFPEEGRIWELNYRGERQFLKQAQTQSEERRLVVFDGWGYFVHGWSSIIGRILDVEIDAETRARMGHIALTQK